MVVNIMECTDSKVNVKLFRLLLYVCEHVKLPPLLRCSENLIICKYDFDCAFNPKTCTIDNYTYNEKRLIQYVHKPGAGSDGK